MQSSARFSKRKEMINDEVALLYKNLQSSLPGVARLAVALYEKESELLHTFLRSPEESELLNHYTVALASVESLNKMAETGEPRVVNDISLIPNSSFHTHEIIEYGIQSSYTLPMFLGDELLGFVFFDSLQKGFFTDETIPTLDVYAQLVEAMLVMDILPVRALMGMLTSSRRLTELKDYETGLHIVRVSAYVEIIATELTNKIPISDELIEYMWLYAPLHDIGKIGVPDKVLLKPDRLDEAEVQVMQTHVIKGKEIIDRMIEDFSFQNLHHIDMLRNMIELHHERWDGLGYPNAIAGENIPVEARILAVADVFDAMSSSRVYRDAYDLDEVFAYIAAHSGKRFDPQCVDALFAQKDRLLEVFASFNERKF